MRPMRRAAQVTSVLAGAALAVALADGCAHDREPARDVPPEEAAAAPDAAIADATPPPLGHTPDPNDILDSGCATATAQVTRQPIYMLVVLDGSGSMNDENKWIAMVPALDRFIDDLKEQGDVSFGVGLTIFSDLADATKGTGPYPTIDVPIAFVDATQAAALHQRLDLASPKGPTPTLAVLRGQYPAIESFVASPPLLPNGKKVVVLMTDGVPYPNTDDKAPCVQAAKDELAKDAPAGPITTFAVGIGHFFPYDPYTYDPEFMAELAVAGGAPNDPCDVNELMNVDNMCHFQVTPAPAGSAFILEQQLLAAFDKIRSEVTSCTLTLQKADGGSPVDPSKVNVVFTDTKGSVAILKEDPKDGWSYDDPNNPTQVILNGEACTRLKKDPDGTLSVVLGCKSIVK